MSSCLSGGGRAYRLEPLDIEFIKSPSSSSWTSNSSSSPSSTLSESSISPLAISTRKPRTPRKRPNQTYNEAAAILSTAHPKIFPTKNLTKFTKSHDTKIPFFEPSDLLITPFQVIERPHFGKGLNSFEKEISSKEVFGEKCEDFDAKSMLDEEIGQGIDSIMGNSGSENGILNDELSVFSSVQMDTSTCYGYPMGLGFDFGFGVRNDLRAMRNVDEGDWWSFPSVNVLDLNPKIDKISTKKMKKKMVEIKNLEPYMENSISCLEEKKEDLEIVAQTTNVGLLLKLNYDDVLHEWSDKASPFSGDGSGNESTGKDVQARLAQIDLFSENGGIREASVLRYKEKRRTRLFSKKIRYQVRKVNADRRPRIKGRFVRTPNSPED